MSDLPVVLLLGRTGQVGSEVERILAGRAALVAPDETTLDLRDAAGLRAAVRKAAPTAIVNAAGYTAVDRAEEEPDVAHTVNAVAPGVLAEEAARAGALLVHYSTDYVFDGAKGAPYVEDDVPSPLSVYGRTKWEGELRVVAAGDRFVILRTAWVYGPKGHNFLRTMLRLFAEQEEVRIVDDQVGAPTTARFMAEATVRVIAAAPPASWSGTYHCTASGQTSWYGLAQRLFELDRRVTKLCRRVVPVPSSDYPTAARRPRWSVLDCRRFTERFGFPQRPWEDLLAETMAEMDGRA